MAKESWLDRLAVQTIIWGEDFPDGLEATMDEIADLGFKGVEFAQVPAKLGNPQEFERTMQSHGLHFLGMAGGSLRARLDFCRQLSLKPDYLYVQKWEEEIAPQAIKEGHTLALHPHHYTRIDNAARAVEEITKAATSNLVLLPDTAHLYLANEQFLEVLEENKSLIHVVHLKDWTPEFGWSMFTYARGFTELGGGIVPLSASWQVLREWLIAAPNRWVVVEQDHTQRKVNQSLSISLRWLKEGHCRENKEDIVSLSDYNYARSVQLDSVAIDRSSPSDQHRFTQMISKLNRFLLRSSLDSFRNVDRLFLTILEELADLLDLRCASLWEINTRLETARLRSFWQPPNQAKASPHIRVIALSQALSGLAVEERSVKYFTDVQKPHGLRHFADNAFVKEFRLQGMVSIPISNHWNMNQPELLVNLFPNSHYSILNAPVTLSSSFGMPHPSPPLESLYDEDQLNPQFRFATRHVRQSIAICVERAWEQIRSVVTNEVDWIARRERTTDEFLAALAKPISRRLECRSVEIYLMDQSGLFLTLHAPTKSNRSVFKVMPEDKGVGQTWKDRSVTNSGAFVERTDAMSSTYLRMPIYAQSLPLGRELLGVISCSETLHSRPESDDFSLTDEVILDAFQAAIAPFLERMQAAKTRTETMRRITHELKGPLTVFRGASKYALKEMAENGWVFSQDYLQQMRSYITLMEQIVAKAGFLRVESGLKLQRRRVLLFDDIIMPVIFGLEDYLNDRGFSKSNIDVDRVRDTRHALFLDKLRFQQVIFNLLSNSVKYAFRDPELFKVTITAKEFGGLIVLTFSDWGTGIPMGMDESIFREGVRGPNADELDAAGEGLGLWLVREIIRAHEGRITVTSPRNPTEFTVTLPTSVKVPIFHGNSDNKGM